MRLLLVVVVAALVAVVVAREEAEEPHSGEALTGPHLLEKRVLEDQILEDELTSLEEQRHPSHHQGKDRTKKISHHHTHGKKIKTKTEVSEISSSGDGGSPFQEDLPHPHHPPTGPHPAPEDDELSEELEDTTDSSVEEVTLPHVEPFPPAKEFGLPAHDVSPTVEAEGDPQLEEPVVLPVTEGKNQGQDSVVYHGLPKELMPIHPGGGSRFDDLERERLERAKMAQTKADEGDEDNASSHDAEELYSSASTLCISSLILSLSSFRLLM